MFKNLLAYKKSYLVAMKIFRLSKNFPLDERHSLTMQIRRSSRSVCANFAEAFRRSSYPKYFQVKLNDASTENAETEIWLDFSRDCGYLSDEEYKEIYELNTEAGKLIYYIANHPEKFL